MLWSKLRKISYGLIKPKLSPQEHKPRGIPRNFPNMNLQFKHYKKVQTFLVTSESFIGPNVEKL